MSKVVGILGVKWGDDSEDAAARLGMSCAQRWAWEGGGNFEICLDSERAIAAYGGKGYVQLICKGGKVEGIQLIFRDCAADESRLRDNIKNEIGLKTESQSDLYESWSSGEVVRFIRDVRDDVCVLTVAGPRFGEAYRSHLLSSGLSELFTGLKP